MSTLPSFLMALALLFSPPIDSRDRGPWLAASDALSLGVFSATGIFPVNTPLNPRLELGWGEVSLGLTWHAVSGFPADAPHPLEEGGLACLDLGAAIALGAWRPRLSLGWGWATLNPYWGEGWGSFGGFSLALAPFRFAFPLSSSWDMEASALELRWGPLFPPTALDMEDLGGFVASVDLLRLGLRLRLGGGREAER